MSHSITPVTVGGGVHGHAMDGGRPYIHQSLIRRHAGVILRFAITFLVLVWLVYRVNMHAVLNLWAHLSPGWLAFSIAIMATARFARCANWAQLLELSGFHRARLYGRLVRLYFAGGFLGAVFPSSAIADAIRAALAQRFLQVSVGELAATATLLNGLTCLATCMLGLVGVSLLFTDADSSQLEFLPVATGIFAGFMLAIAALLALSLWAVKWGSSRKWPSYVPGKVRVFMDELLGVMESLEQTARRFVPLLLLSVAAQLCLVLSMVGLGKAVGVSLPVVACMVAVPFTSLVGFVPASVLGFGALQLFHVYFFQYFGIGKPEAFAVSVLQTTIAVGIHVVLGASFFCSLKVERSSQ